MILEALPFSLLHAFFLASATIATRFGLAPFGPLAFTGLKLALAGLVCAAVYGLDNHRPWPTDRLLWRQAVLLGVVGTAIPQVAFVWSLEYLSAGVAALLVSTQTIFVVVMAHFSLPDERLTRRKCIGVAMASGGVLLLMARGESGLSDIGRANPLGYCLVLLTIACTSATTVVARKNMRGLASFDVTSIRLWVASVLVMPLAVLSGGLGFERASNADILALGVASLAGVLGGQLLSFHIATRFGATPWAITYYLFSMISTVGGILLLGERVTPGILIGMGMIGTAIAVVNSG